MSKKITLIIIIAGLLCTLAQPFFGPGTAWAANEDNNDYALTPPFLTAAAPPLVMIVLGRSHKLYYEAYNDTSDLDGDGDLDVGYNPDEIDYYGYFDSYKCYTYDSGNSRFNPTSLSVSNTAATNTKACSGANEWSGDLLNYLTMSRMDALRKVLYGGSRSTDTATDTVLQRSFIPQDAHSWGKEYKDVATDGYDISEYSPLSLPTAGTRHLFASTTLTDNGDPLLRVLTNESHRIWEWVSIERPVAGDRVENGGTGPSVSPTNYVVKVKVCDESVGLESNCKIYPGTDGKFGVSSDPHKPIGMLQRYGETEQMLFGLITGSYEKNTSGGVLRKTISLIADEIDPNTGEFEYLDTGVDGIIRTIDSLRIKNFRDSDHSYEPGWSGAWVTDRAMTEGEFTDWGNPTAEMMYEGLRYFSGAGSATAAFTYSGGDDDSLGLPLDSWDDPYSANDRWCSQPFMLVVSDINPSYDSDQVPGSAFSAWAAESLGTSGTLNVQTLLDTISTEEGISGDYYIGDQGGTFDSSCAPKTVTSLANLRGLCPEEPTKQGSYYSAAVAYYGHGEDISSAANDQKVLTYTVGLASALPKIEINLGNPVQTITLVPFAKSVGGCLGIAPTNSFTPTNTIVDFYVESITPTSGIFRINYEDVEQAADHDMDAIARYSYTVVDASGFEALTPADGTKVVVTVDGGVYADGCIIQHMGYIISGTTTDGTYLEVRDEDTLEGSDVDYFLDTPAGELPGGAWNDSTYLPLSHSRVFVPGASGAADLLENPLWYAAKWGSFLDHNFNGRPDLDAEWDENEDGSPDNYFYVQNPLLLETNLNRAFLAILERATAGTAASVLSASRSGEGATYQSIFYPKYKNVSWVGNVHALLVDGYGHIREDTNTNLALDNAADKIIEFDAINPGVVKKYTDTNGDGEFTAAEKSAPPNDAVTNESMDTIEYVWSASSWLNALSDAEAVSQKATYGSTAKNRYLFTFIDDGDMVNNNEIVPFTTTGGNDVTIRPYLHLFEPFTSPPGGFNESSAAAAQIDFIRGKDQTGMRNRRYDSDGDSVRDTTYRLGDIITSTATLVGTPAENYDLLYTDESYRLFWLKYQNRRKVVYVGANDGILHAFNAGFFYFDDGSGVWKFGTQSAAATETAYELGAELWGYIPMNLLPHLYWLTKPNYQHVFYVDQKPKIFDARIYDPTLPATDKHPGGWATIMVVGMGFGGGKIRTDKNHDGIYDPNNDVTMKSAYIVMDITDPESAPELLAEISFDDLGLTSSYPGAILVYPQDPLDREADVNKENKWYLVLGSGPNGARLKYSSDTKSFSVGDLMVGETSGTRAEFVSKDTANKLITVTNVVGWFENGERVYHDANGDSSYTLATDPKFVVDTLNSVSDLRDGLSSQQARIYMVDLKELIAGSLKDPLGNDLTGGGAVGAFVSSSVFDDNSLISDFITVDLDLDYATDAMYFGTISQTSVGLGGKVRRIVLTDPDSSIVATSPGSWEKDSTLIDPGQPVTTANTVAMDWKKRTWVFFGTGRFTSNADVADTSQQTYYGIKEPWQDRSGHENYRVDINEDTDDDDVPDLNEMTWEEVSPTYLMDVSNTVVFQSGNIKNTLDGVTYTTVTDLNGNNLDTFLALEREMDKDPSPPANPGATIYPNGWKLNFSVTRERNLGQAALLGDILAFTTYAPDPNACQNEGDSYFYATYYKTGTAFSSAVIGTGDQVDPSDAALRDVLRKQSLGKGLAVSPSMHTGREKGTKAFIQTSTGAILVIEQANPGAVKSGRTYWMED